MSDDFKIVVPTLETTRLLLRPLAASDAPDIFGYASDAAVTRYVFWPRHETLEFSRRFIAWLNGPKIHAQAIVLPSTGQVIGTIFLHSYHTNHQKAEIAFNLSRSHWGRGYTTEAACIFKDHVFANLGLNRIEATCRLENLGSARVLEKLGFYFEGTMRQSHQRAGQFFDMKFFALLRSNSPAGTA